MENGIRVLHYLAFVVFAFCVAETEAGDFCYRRTFHTRTVTYCSYGCCGSYNNEYCCGARGALITGCVFAGILGVAIVIALLCCCIKKQGHSGRVVQPIATSPPYGSAPGQNVTVVYSAASGQYPTAPPYPGTRPLGPPAQPVAPPAYNQFENTPPPAYTYTNPAFLPPLPPATPAPDTPAPAGFSVNSSSSAPEGGISSTASPSTKLAR